ncbi:MAG: protoglobin domain-containing protein [Polyangiales bacterium]
MTTARDDSGVSTDDWERRKTFVGFGPDDEAILAELHIVAKTYADQVMEELYERWLRFPQVRAFFDDPARLARVKSLQKQYFIRLTSGDYGAAYLVDRLRIGHVHRRIGLAPQWYMGAYSIYLQTVMPRILAAFEYDRAKRDRAVSALLKLVSLDQEVAIMTYFGEPAGRVPSAE